MSASALSLDAMLNMITVELELMPDADMYLFFEKGMRVSVSYISKRYSKTNNKYLKSYDSKEESKHYIYTQIQIMVMQCLRFFQQAASNR